MAAADHTRVFFRAPSAALRPFVRRFLVVESTAARRDSHLPDTGLVAAFGIRGDCRLDGGALAPRAAITGLWDRLRRHDHGPGHTVALVSFTPTGAAAFLRCPLDELANRTVALEGLADGAPAFARLEEQLAEASGDLRRVELVEEFLVARVHATKPDPLVAAAVSWIERAPPAARIEHLVRHIGLSQSALERRFRRRVGASPKRFASLVRLQTVVRLRAAGGSLTSIAHAAGYFDQSHFVHDFQRVAGLAPESYFARAASG